jgi:hypothetical protein
MEILPAGSCACIRAAYFKHWALKKCLDMCWVVLLPNQIPASSLVLGNESQLWAVLGSLTGKETLHSKQPVSEAELRPGTAASKVCLLAFRNQNTLKLTCKLLAYSKALHSCVLQGAMETEGSNVIDNRLEPYTVLAPAL